MPEATGGDVTLSASARQRTTHPTRPREIDPPWVRTAQCCHDQVSDHILTPMPHLPLPSPCLWLHTRARMRSALTVSTQAQPVLGASNSHSYSDGHARRAPRVRPPAARLCPDARLPATCLMPAPHPRGLLAVQTPSWAVRWIALVPISIITEWQSTCGHSGFSRSLMTPGCFACRTPP